MKVAAGGSIIIMHANGRGVHTADALPSVISYLRSRGCKLVTVSELLASKQRGAPPPAEELLLQREDQVELWRSVR